MKQSKKSESTPRQLNIEPEPITRLFLKSIIKDALCSVVSELMLTGEFTHQLIIQSARGNLPGINNNYVQTGIQ